MKENTQAKSRKKPKSRYSSSDEKSEKTEGEREEEKLHNSHFKLHTEGKNREPKKKDLFLASREKLLRAYGGCLGAECRRRTWDTAKSPGEL